MRRFLAVVYRCVIPFVIWMPNLLWLGMAWPDSEFSFSAIAIGLASIAFTLASFPKQAIGLLFLAPFAVLAPAEIFYLATFGRPSDAHLFGILSETNLPEAYEFMGSSGFLLVAVSLLVLLWSIAIVRTAFRDNWQWRGRSRIWVLVASIVLMVQIALPDALLGNADALPAALAPDVMVIGTEGSIAGNLLGTAYPTGLPFRIAKFGEQRQGMTKALEALESFRFAAVQSPAVDARQVHILVIGETGRPDRWQLNGYQRPTNPHLAGTEGLISFSNVISGWAWTRMSVPVILTRKPVRESRAFFPEKSLVAAFREAGYKTYWFSTQSPLGMHDSSIALHANEADEARFLNATDYKNQGTYDDELLPLVQDVLAKGEKKQLIVLHTLGGHYNYSHRYPDDFDRFQPSLKGRKDADLHDPSQKEVMNNSYDNSVLFVDSILARLIEKLARTGAAASLFYVADHGENLFDEDCNKSGHGHSTEYDFRVPAIWWNSNEYEKRNPEKVHNLGIRRDAPISTENVFHTILDLANIHYPEENLGRSFANVNWKPASRLTQTGLDFDRASRDHKCKTLMPFQSGS